MFGELRTAALLAKAVAGDAAAFDDAFALRAATLGGACAMGLQAAIGSVEPGKRADLAAVRMDEVETQPLYNVVSQLAYAVSRRQVSDVWIDGHRKLGNGELVDFDLAGVLERARRWRERIIAL
jgi:5-methylthioadenosine/S-adenosylhomocysteine deaminase